MSSPTVTDQCFICLEEGTAESSVLVLNFALYPDIPCSCRVACHMKCWTSYYVKKNGFECPICHCRDSAAVAAMAAALPPALRPRLPTPPPSPQRLVIIVNPSAYEEPSPTFSTCERAGCYMCILTILVGGIISILRVM